MYQSGAYHRDAHQINDVSDDASVRKNGGDVGRMPDLYNSTSLQLLTREVGAWLV